ncbi:MAG: hypothetical protein PHF60_03065 [Candidatus ainarchaeum sp.]|nr:hypothetical protein [Candidatus ainarchaeum sp.]
MDRKKLKVPERSDSSALAMVKGFKGYGPEQEHAVRVPEVREDDVLKQLRQAWKEYAAGGRVQSKAERTKIALMFEKIDYSADDIENFSIALAEFQDAEDFSNKAGLFLSALMNNCKDSDFTIHTCHLAVPLHLLGHHNTKNITIDGDAGYYLGDTMDGGSITVKGNAGSWVGTGMTSGTITIEGNAGDCAGAHASGPDIASGPKIFIKGDAGNDIGLGAWHVSIYVDGKIWSISMEVQSAHIYEKGVLVFDK